MELLGDMTQEDAQADIRHVWSWRACRRGTRQVLAVDWFAEGMVSSQCGALAWSGT